MKFMHKHTESFINTVLQEKHQKNKKLSVLKTLEDKLKDLELQLQQFEEKEKAKRLAK